MPVAKLLGTSTSDAMKSDEGSDSLDTLIRQAVGKEPLFSFSRTGDSPTQWIQLLHTFDQPDLPGWPLLAPMKVQLQKCEKCSREFCSTINYRRHIRVHRRSMNFHKEPQKYRDLLGAFWDKLNHDEAKDIMSFKDVTLEDVPGSSIVKNIAANLRKPIFLSLPQVYVKAGSALVDIIQGRPSMLPVSSQELFSVLDDASERTFLCAGTAESLKKYVFDGEAGKIGLEMKNLIACTCFLVEQKLVKAWLADKDAEALKCQKLLVEEEEAAQRRQAQLLERKRQRKIRQKEQRERDNGMKVELSTASDSFDSIPAAETSSREISPEIDPLITDGNIASPTDAILLSSNEEAFDHPDSAANEQQKTSNNSPHFIARWQMPKSQRNGRNGRHINQNGNFVKWEPAHKHSHREYRATNGGKIWTKKPKPESNVKSRVHNDADNQTGQNSCQLMIGSISVTVRNSTGQPQVSSSVTERHESTKNKTKSSQNVTNRSNLKLWRTRNDNNGQLADVSKSQTSEEDVASASGVAQNLTTEGRNESFDSNGNETEDTIVSNVQVEGGDNRPMHFSADAAKDFLSQRWKEAVSGEHVELVLTTAEPAAEVAVQVDHPESDSPKGKVGNANVKHKFRTKQKTKYIPKARPVY